MRICKSAAFLDWHRGKSRKGGNYYKESRKKQEKNRKGMIRVVTRFWGAKLLWGKMWNPIKEEICGSH